MINRNNIIRCNRCRYPITTNKIIKEDTGEIVIKIEESIALKVENNSFTAKCMICKDIIGIINKTDKYFILFRNKCEVNSLIKAE